MDKSTKRRGVAAIALSSVAAVALVAGMTATQATTSTPVTPIVATPWPGYADLIDQIMPTVVVVTTTRTAEQRPAGDSGGWREFRGPQGFGQFREFRGPGGDEMERFMERFFGERGPFANPRGFGPGMPHGMPMGAAGSGFIVDADGLIVTNFHVIDGADQVTVTLSDGRDFEAKIVGSDPDTDLAVLKIDAGEKLPVATFADADQVRVGDPVIAIGNPFGLGGTVTAGIVSAKDRALGAGRYDDFFQIDAPINHGNSGGPTFDLQGRVIGVNTAIQSPTGGNVGIGFAIPADLVQDVVADLRDDGMVERGWLGVHIQAVDEDLAKSLDLAEAEGALVAQVTEDSPAARAGLEQGDVILSYQGKTIEHLRDLTRAVADTDPGTDAAIVVWHDGKERTMEVEIGQMPGENQVLAMGDQNQSGADTPKLGVMLAQLTPDARDSLNLPADVVGVLVTDVQPGSPAAAKGLRQGDVIIEADHQEMKDPEMVAKAVQGAAERGDEAILLLIKRDGQDRFVAVHIERA
jgi:serine protease Do